MTQKPYSPQTLSERWGCSAEKIRIMCKNGELSSFTIGKLIRIPAIEVERIECESGDLQSTEENTHSLGTSQDEHNRFESRLVRRTKGLRNLALVKCGTPEASQKVSG